MFTLIKQRHNYRVIMSITIEPMNFLMDSIESFYMLLYLVTS